MDDKNARPATESSAPQPDWRALPFDAVTNFSLLGWIFDKLRQGRKSEERIDLRLDA